MRKDKITKFSVDMSIGPFNFETSNNSENQEAIERMERIKSKINSHPLQTRMQVSIFYKGRNRNNTFIDDDVAEQLKSTFPNTPIVGEYWEAVDDFGTHGLNIQTDAHGDIQFNRTTIPFGVIPSDSEIWYELRTDKDGVERNYICSEVVFWSKRYDELSDLIKLGRPQSMEIDPATVNGEWIEMDDNFVFKYSTAYLSALCILGQDIEPCFEGAAFSTFSIKNSWSNFQKECKEMFNDIKSSCKIEEDKLLNKVNNFNLINDGVEIGQKIQIFTTGLNITNKGGKFKMGEINLKFANTTDVRETIYKSINAFNSETNTYDFKYVITNIVGEVATVFNYEDNTYYNIKFTLSGNEIRTEAPIVANVIFQNNDEVKLAQESLKNYANLKADNVKLNRDILEVQSKLKDHQLTNDEYISLKNNADQFESIKTEYATLKQYMLDNERIEKENIIKKFAKIGEVELKTFKDNIDNFTAEQLDEKLSAFAFKKGISLNDKTLDAPKPVYSFTEVPGSEAKPASNVPAWFSMVVKREDELNFGIEE